MVRVVRGNGIVHSGRVVSGASGTNSSLWDRRGVSCVE